MIPALHRILVCNPRAPRETRLVLCVPRRNSNRCFNPRACWDATFLLSLISDWLIGFLTYFGVFGKFGFFGDNCETKNVRSDESQEAIGAYQDNPTIRG